MLVDDPDEKIECRPDNCGRCAGDLAGASVFARQRRQVIDMPPPVEPHVTEYVVESLLCPGCGEVTCGQRKCDPSIACNPIMAQMGMNQGREF